MSVTTLTATLSATPTDGHATITVSAAATAALQAGPLYWFTVEVVPADGITRQVVPPSRWTAVASAANSSSLACHVLTANAGKVPLRQDISWQSDRAGTIALVFTGSTATAYDLTGATVTLTLRTKEAAVLPAVANIQGILADVFATMQLAVPSLKILGPAEDGEQVRPPKIAWGPARAQYSARNGFRLGSTGSPGMLWIRELPIEFELFAGDPGGGDYGMSETEGLVELLINSLHQRLGPTGYGTPEEAWVNGGRTGAGLACNLTVSVRIPLVRTDNRVVTLTTVNTTVDVGMP